MTERAFFGMSSANGQPSTLASIHSSASVTCRSPASILPMVGRERFHPAIWQRVVKRLLGETPADAQPADHRADDVEPGHGACVAVHSLSGSSVLFCR